MPAGSEGQGRGVCKGVIGPHPAGRRVAVGEGESASGDNAAAAWAAGHRSCVRTLRSDVFRNQLTVEVPMSRAQTYLIGFIILIIGVAGAAYLIDVPVVWIAVGVVALVGVGIMGASRSRSGEL